MGASPENLIVQGANLHNISSEHSTPFLDFLQGLVFYPMELSVSDFDDMQPMELSRHELGDQSPRPSLLKIWLDCLQESGLDLEEYGRKEVDLHLQGLVSWTWLPYDPKPDRAWFLTSLTYGPSPSDWKGTVVYRHKRVAESPGRMPGGWTEEEGGEVEVAKTLDCIEGRVEEKDPYA